MKYWGTSTPSTCSQIVFRVGITKPICSVPLFSEFFSIMKTHVSYWISYLYLAGVAAAAVAPVKYRCDSNNLRDTFVKLKNAYREIDKRSYGNLHPDRRMAYNQWFGAFLVDIWCDNDVIFTSKDARTSYQCGNNFNVIKTSGLVTGICVSLHQVGSNAITL